ncbi:MAG: hypothetical protein HFJ75_07745 [Eggerthellaceae bacterium]|nr:hypothetical protein [Eggerthellaceae bacterium]
MAEMIKAADLAKVSAIDFVESFHEDIRVLQEVLGITRKVEKVPGQVIKTYKVVGTLEDGAVAEGEDIPLSHYKTEVAGVFELTLEKYRKQTTLEAINDKGYKQAVVDTDTKMRRQVQARIRGKFFNFIKTGTGTASGKGLKGALAQTRAELTVLFEDYGVGDSDLIYMVNPYDIADHLEDTELTTQEVFGMRYIEKFLNLYDVLEFSGVPQGKVIATAKDNLILYYTNPANSEVGKAFDFITDETGLIGIHHDTTYRNLTTDTVVVCGLEFYAELIDRVVVGTIASDGAAAAALADFGVPVGPGYPEDKALDDMTIGELKAYAEWNGIDIKGLTKKQDILDAILRADDEPAEGEPADEAAEGQEA